MQKWALGLCVCGPYVTSGQSCQIVCGPWCWVCVTLCSRLSTLELNLCDDAANAVTSKRMKSNSTDILIHTMILILLHFPALSWGLIRWPWELKRTQIDKTQASKENIFHKLEHTRVALLERILQSGKTKPNMLKQQKTKTLSRGHNKWNASGHGPGPVPHIFLVSPGNSFRCLLYYLQRFCIWLFFRTAAQYGGYARDVTMNTTEWQHSAWVPRKHKRPI